MQQDDVLSRFVQGSHPPEHRPPARYVLRYKTLLHLEGQRSQIDKEAPEPDVTRRRIEVAVANRRNPILVLEEFDKVKMSEFKADAIFDVIDALYEAKGQLVLTTNLTMTEYEGLFHGDPSLRVTGEALTRRIRELCNVRDYLSPLTTDLLMRVLQTGSISMGDFLPVIFSNALPSRTVALEKFVNFQPTSPGHFQISERSYRKQYQGAR